MVKISALYKCKWKVYLFTVLYSTHNYINYMVNSRRTNCVN